MTFSDLGLSQPVLKALKGIGYETPSAIQAATIPTLLGGRDVVGMAQTGTGKTAAFALPIIDRLDLSQKTPQALVLAPTRELALQVCEAFEKYAGHLKDVHVLPVYGGQGYGVQLSALRRGVHIVVGTPGRIIDHLEKGTLDLSALQYLVLDEADEMLKMGFAEDVETILAETPATKQVALFSATMPAQIRRIASQYLRDPEEITVKSKTQTSANISQRYLITAWQQKMDALTRILEVENFDGMIVFGRTRSVTEEIAEKLRARGYSAAAINGDIAQPQREKTVNQLKSGKLDILVATDVAARGLDVERVSHVVNYDIPTDAESYVHRIGRTGRAGRTGDAISFVTPRERGLVKMIERATRQQLTEIPLPSVDEVNVTRLSRFDDRITAALGEAERIEAFRDIVAHYVRNHDVPEADVAAALAVVAQGDTPLLLEPDAGARARGAHRAPRSRRPSGARRAPRPARGLRDVPHRRRQAPARRAPPDRGRTRERGRPAPRRLRRDQDHARLLTRRAARQPLARCSRPARRHPHLGAAHRAASRQRTPAAPDRWGVPPPRRPGLEQPRLRRLGGTRLVRRPSGAQAPAQAHRRLRHPSSIPVRDGGSDDESPARDRRARRAGTTMAPPALSLRRA